MSKVYCGANKEPPKNSRFGTFKECAEKGQLRRYGRKLIPEDYEPVKKTRKPRAKKAPTKKVTAKPKPVYPELPPSPKAKKQRPKLDDTILNKLSVHIPEHLNKLPKKLYPPLPLSPKIKKIEYPPLPKSYKSKKQSRQELDDEKMKKYLVDTFIPELEKKLYLQEPTLPDDMKEREYLMLKKIFNRLPQSDYHEITLQKFIKINKTLISKLKNFKKMLNIPSKYEAYIEVLKKYDYFLSNIVNIDTENKYDLIVNSIKTNIAELRAHLTLKANDKQKNTLILLNNIIYMLEQLLKNISPSNKHEKYNLLLQKLKDIKLSSKDIHKIIHELDQQKLSIKKEKPVSPIKISAKEPYKPKKGIQPIRQATKLDELIEEIVSQPQLKEIGIKDYLSREHELVIIAGTMLNDVESNPNQYNIDAYKQAINDIYKLFTNYHVNLIIKPSNYDYVKKMVTFMIESYEDHLASVEPLALKKNSLRDVVNILKLFIQHYKKIETKLDTIKIPKTKNKS